MPGKIFLSSAKTDRWKLSKISIPSISKDVLDPGDEDPNIDVEPMPLNVKKRCAQALLHICDGLQSVKNLQLRKVKSMF